MKLDFKAAHERAIARAAVNDDVDDIFLSPAQRKAKHRLQAYATEIADRLLTDGMLHHKVVCTVEDNRRGWANFKNRTISLPTWLITRPWRFQQQYALHELAHLVMHDDDPDFQDGHGAWFQKCEADLMHRFLRLKPLYNRKRGYAFAFMNVDSHVLEFDGDGYPPNHAKFNL